MRPALWYNAISIHALLAESDGAINPVTGLFWQFLSTLSLRRATLYTVGLLNPVSHFYPRSPCGERQAHRKWQLAISDFYPRSPCGERLKDMLNVVALMDFYPRSPCGERRHSARAIMKAHGFLSTLSLRRATGQQYVTADFFYHFYPRSPCGERPEHGICRGGIRTFLSTLSLRRATPSHCRYRYSRAISIHALLAESDREKASVKSSSSDFYPRSPCGERHR